MMPPLDDNAAIRQAIIKEAKTWIGTPWRHEAEVKGAGVDCGKLVYCVYRDCGLVDPLDVPSYSRQWMLHKNDEEMLRWAGLIGLNAVPAPLPGDVAVWKVGRTYSHAGIVVDWPLVIHADTVADCVIPAEADNSKLSGRAVIFLSRFNR